MLRTTIKIVSTGVAAAVIAVPIASGTSHPGTPGTGQGYSLGAPVQHLSKGPSVGGSLVQCPCNIGLPIQPRGLTASAAVGPDIRQTDPRASGPFTTDTLGGNGHPEAAKGYRIITDTLGGNGAQPASPQGVLDAVKRSSPNQVGLAWQYLRDTGQITAATTPSASRPDERGSADGIEPNATAIVSSPARFHWGDAGTGAAGGAALMMLLGGVALTQRRSRRRPRTTA